MENLGQNFHCDNNVTNSKPHKIYLLADSSFKNIKIYSYYFYYRDSIQYFYEVFCEVSPGYNQQEPYIVRKYPESYKNEEELRNIPKFTFPCQLDT